jgi:hypothetical protein
MSCAHYPDSVVDVTVPRNLFLASVVVFMMFIIVSLPLSVDLETTGPDSNQSLTTPQLCAEVDRSIQGSAGCPGI